MTEPLSDYRKYMPAMKREVKFIGELPAGDWVMHAVPTSGAKWAIVLADRTGKHPPRIVKDGEMSVLSTDPVQIAKAAGGIAALGAVFYAGEYPDKTRP